MDVIGRSLLTVGILSLLHAGYSTIQYRSYLKIIEEEYSAIPIDIAVQVLLSVVLAILGVVRVSGELKDIHAAAELASKSWETLGNRPSFYMFNHRGKMLFQNEDDDDDSSYNE